MSVEERRGALLLVIGLLIAGAARLGHADGAAIIGVIIALVGAGWWLTALHDQGMDAR